MLRSTSLAAVLIFCAPVAFAQGEDVSASVDAPADEQVILVADFLEEDEANETVIATGNVEISFQGRNLRADKVSYNRLTERVHASGNVVIVDPDGTQRFAKELEVGINLSDGYAVGFSTRMATGATAVATSAIRDENGVSILDQIVYTACELCDGNDTPTWSLRARKAVLDPQTQMYSYRDAVLEVAGIPVFYMPYFAHPDPSSDRRSGLLAPSFGTSTKLGAFYQQPYYWAISPTQDLTIAPKVMVNVKPLIELNYRKRFWSGEIEIDTSFTNDRDFDSDGIRFGEEEWRSHIYAQGLFDISENWQWGFGAERVTDDLYTRRYDIEGENKRRGLYDGQPRRLLSQLYVVGQDTDFYADASVQSIQGLRAGDIDAKLPTLAPLFFTEKLFHLGDYGLASVTASGSFLTREVGIDSQRMSIGADWSTTRILPGGLLLEPFAEARGDYYILDEDVSGEANVTRGVGTAGARLSYPLYRPGKAVDILLKPTVMVALGTSNSNKPTIPREDGLLYEFDEASLFDANGFGNYDRYEGDGKAAIGFIAQARWKDGTNITATAGRRWRSRADPNFDVASNLNGTTSDWVGGISADFGRPLKVEARVRLDEDTLELNRIDTRISSNWNRLSGSLRYYRIAENITPSGVPDEGLDVRGQLRVTDAYSMVYGRQRDIAGNRDLRHSIGVAYEDDCSRFEISFERSEATDRTLGPSDGLKFRFSLKTLGEFGSNEFD
ncbi:MAG: LPS assembly protein LptD [Hyphomonadaceae bacterium]